MRGEIQQTSVAKPGTSPSMASSLNSSQRTITTTTTVQEAAQPLEECLLLEPNTNPTTTDFHPQHQHHQVPQDDFLEQMISTLPSWADLSPSPFSHKIFSTPSSLMDKPDDTSPDDLPCYDDSDSTTLASRLIRHHQISGGGGGRPPLGLLQLNTPDLGLNHGCRTSPGRCMGDGGGGGFPLPLSLGHDSSSHPSRLAVEKSRDDVDASFKHNMEVQGLYNGFQTGGSGADSNPQHFQSCGGQTAGMNQTLSSPARPRVRARRGQATDPHSIAERLRRERIAERMKALQELVPNGNKTDKASMLDEIIDYVKFLQLQVKVLSMSRLGGAAAVAPFIADISSAEASGGVGRRSNSIGRDHTATVSSTQENNTLTAAEHQVAKLMEEDMGSAMQYLQGKGLCLMPISLASAISTATCHSKNAPSITNNNTNKISSNSTGIMASRVPTTPSMSMQSVLGDNGGGSGGGGEVMSRKDSTSISYTKL